MVSEKSSDKSKNVAGEDTKSKTPKESEFKFKDAPPAKPVDEVEDLVGNFSL